MRMQRILCPTDFSKYGNAAIELATSLARDNDATLVIAHVEEPPIAYGGGEMYSGLDARSALELKSILEETKPSDPQVRYEHRMLVGDPAGAIVRCADDDNIDLIVLGTHGRSGLTRLVMGSVAEAVVRRASCPVLTVKQTLLAAAADEST